MSLQVGVLRLVDGGGGLIVRVEGGIHGNPVTNHRHKVLSHGCNKWNVEYLRLEG